jgi:hypothetical protein
MQNDELKGPGELEHPPGPTNTPIPTLKRKRLSTPHAYHVIPRSKGRTLKAEEEGEGSREFIPTIQPNDSDTNTEEIFRDDDQPMDVDEESEPEEDESSEPEDGEVKEPKGKEKEVIEEKHGENLEVSEWLRRIRRIRSFHPEDYQKI